MFAAVYRRAPVEQKAYYEEEAVSLEMALKASTIEAARLAGLEDHLGTLRSVSPPGLDIVKPPGRRLPDVRLEINIPISGC